MCSRIFRAAYKKAPDAAFWLFVGDLVDNGDKDEEWAELFYALGWIPRMTPMILLPVTTNILTKDIFKTKTTNCSTCGGPILPSGKRPQGLEESAYSIDYQGVRLVMLNGNEKLRSRPDGWIRSCLKTLSFGPL